MIQTVCRIIVFALCAVLAAGASLAQTPDASQGSYNHATPTRDGTGKYYFGREIAQVMGHRGARWLERKSRIEEEAPDQAVGLAWIETRHFLPTQHFMVFAKPDSQASQ